MKLTREELYELVWQKPIREVAAELGMSDVGLAKACRKSSIPLPRQGHWLKKPGSERDQLRPALPPPIQGTRLIFDFKPGDLSEAYDGELARTEAKQRLERTPTLAGMDETISLLLKNTRKYIQLRKTDVRGIIICQGSLPWPCRTSPEQVDRGMAILGKLWARLQTLGYSVMQSEKNPAMVDFEIDGGNYWYWVEEHANKHERDYTPKELAEKRNAEVERRYFFEPNRWVYTPTGKLNVKLGNGFNDYARRRWGDGASATLEQRVDEIIAETLVFATAEKRQRETRALEAAAEADRKLRIRLKLQQQEYEKLKIQQLRDESVAWSEAQSLRRYVEAVRNASLVQLSQFESEAARSAWVLWAASIIDQLDPLLSGMTGKTIPVPTLPEIPWSYRYQPDDGEDNN